VLAIPNKPSAAKRVRQNEKRHLRNLRRKRQIRLKMKQFDQHVTAGETERAKALVPELVKAVDKAAQHRSIHPNKAARIKSRLMKRVN